MGGIGRTFCGVFRAVGGRTRPAMSYFHGGATSKKTHSFPGVSATLVGGIARGNLQLPNLSALEQLMQYPASGVRQGGRMQRRGSGPRAQHQG